ncbi:hypothetical protein DSO57_1026281 [Entomophthora muscae]|uniref:Uncharacterized protein n=1 Tax=Entomophthora muscae TaxID=34485 RepID=A0ACC2TP23_9FUNG|nr:hypothetical protein DSO57_1026281 [Entomophthora muscae]
MEGLRSGRKQCKWQMFTFSGQFMFRTRSRTPIDSVRVLDNILQKWTAGIQPTPKLVSEVVKHIFNIKAFLVSSEQEFTSEQISEFIKEVKDTDIIPLLILHMEKVDMESRKNVVKIFSSLMRYHSESPVSMVEYVATKPEILFALFHSYENKATALTCGMMLRECLRWEHLARTVLFSSNFYSFFEYVELVTFDLASDAFATFREILTRHKKLVNKFMLQEYEKFFDKFKGLLFSTNYATRRLALKLLGDLLLERANFRVMTIYISKKENLKLVMNLLKDKSRNIQLEAFHIFKIFVANPQKAPHIASILKTNKDKLINYMESFHNDKNNDQRFHEEKEYVINQLRSL